MNGCMPWVLSLQSCPALCDSMDCSPPGSSVHGDSPGKNTEVGCHALLQGIFPTQGLNPCLLCLLHWQVGSLPQAPPRNLDKWINNMIYSKNGILFAIKRNELLIHATTCIYLENIMLKEETSHERAHHCMLSFVCNDQNKQNLKDRQ